MPFSFRGDHPDREALALVLVNRSTRVAFGIGFSVGLMLLILSLKLIPKAWHVAGPLHATVAIGAGAVLLNSAYLVVLGLTLHDVPEGFAMANAYIVSPSLGQFVAIGIALHNIPDEFAMARGYHRTLFSLWGAVLVSSSMPFWRWSSPEGMEGRG